MMGSYLEGGAARPATPPNGVYRTADGFLSVTVVRLFEWEAYCKALDLTAFAADERLRTTEGREAHKTELEAVLRPLLESAPTAIWSAKLGANRVMHEALNSYTEFLRQPHVAESGAVAWTTHPHVPQPIPLPNIVGMPPFVDGQARTIAPGKGEHSAAILREHGFGAADIERLVADGVVGV